MTPYILATRDIGEANTELTSKSGIGRGLLTEATSATVTEERNGTYVLELDYPTTGKLYSELVVGAIIAARGNQIDFEQPFRIEQVKADIYGTVHITARHAIIADLAHCTLISAVGGRGPVSLISNMTYRVCGGSSYGPQITYTTDGFKDTGTVYDYVGDPGGSPLDAISEVIDRYGGELHYVENVLTLAKSRGKDRGAVIRYGANMTAGNFTWSMSGMAGKLIPYYEDNASRVDGDAIPLSVTDSPYDRYVQYVDVTDLIDSSGGKPTASDVTAAGKNYLSARPTYGQMPVNYEVSWSPGLQAETIGLCDTVTVEHADLGISISSLVTKTTWDVLMDRYTKVEIGTPKLTAAKQISKIKTATVQLVEVLPAR